MMNQSCCSTGLTIGGDACRASREEAKNNRQAAEKAGSWLLLQRSVGDCVKVPRLLVDDLWFSSARNIWIPLLRDCWSEGGNGGQKPLTVLGSRRLATM
jgi:hypothetical protein